MPDLAVKCPSRLILALIALRPAFTRCLIMLRSNSAKASAKAIKGRPQLEKAIDALGTGDVLVVAEWDRAARSMMDGVHIIERIHARRAMIKVLDKPHLDLTTPIGRGFIAFLSALAEDERQRIVKRANDGRAAARKRGVHMGRKPKLTELQRRVVRERIARGTVPGLLPRSGAWLTPRWREPSYRRVLEVLLGQGCRGGYESDIRRDQPSRYWRTSFVTKH